MWEQQCQFRPLHGNLHARHLFHVWEKFWDLLLLLSLQVFIPHNNWVLTGFLTAIQHLWAATQHKYIQVQSRKKLRNPRHYTYIPCSMIVYSCEKVKRSLFIDLTIFKRKLIDCKSHWSLRWVNEVEIRLDYLELKTIAVIDVLYKYIRDLRLFLLSYSLSHGHRSSQQFPLNYHASLL